MKKVLIGLSLTTLTTFFLMLIFISYREGSAFSLRDFFTSFMSDISSYQFKSLNTFDKIKDIIKDVASMRFPSGSADILKILKALLNLLVTPIKIIFEVLKIPLNLLIDFITVVLSLINSVGAGWLPLTL